MKIDLSKQFDTYGFAPLRTKFLKADNRLFLLEKDCLSLWKLEDKPRLLGRIRTGKGISWMEVNPEASRCLIFFYREKRAELWSLETLELLGNLDAEAIPRLSLEYHCNSSCGKFICFTGGDLVYRIPWNGTGQLIPLDEIAFDLNIELGIASISAQAAGNKLLLSIADYDGMFTFVMEETQNGSWLEDTEFHSAIEAVDKKEQFRFSPTGKYLLSTFQYQPVVIDAIKKELIYETPLLEGPGRLARAKFFNGDRLLYWLKGRKLFELNMENSEKRLVFEADWDIMDYTWTPQGIFHSTLEEVVEGDFKSRLMLHSFR